MKKVFLASAGVAATLLGVGSAQAATGFVGASYSRVNFDSSGTDVDANGYGVHGSVNLDAGSFELQFDGSYSDAEDSAADGVLAGAAHIFGRNESRAFGAFVSAADSDGSMIWSVGGELAAYMDNTTFAAVGAYSDLGDAEGDAITIGGEFRFFPSDNLRFDAGLGWANANLDSGASTDGFTWGLGGEWQLGSAPISVFGGVTQVHLNDVSATVTASTLGVRYNFGGTLKERDRTGPSQGLSTGASLTGVF